MSLVHSAKINGHDPTHTSVTDMLPNPLPERTVNAKLMGAAPDPSEKFT